MVGSDQAMMYTPYSTVHLSIQRPVCGFPLSRKRSYQRERWL